MGLARFLLPLSVAAALAAHPMGRESVSHYTRITVDSQGADLVYVLDLAEGPAAELLRDWKLERSSPREQLESKASEQARIWARNLKITANGQDAPPEFRNASLSFGDGLRVETRLHVPVSGGRLEFYDGNFPGRPGWKEIVINAGDRVAIEKTTQSGRDRSKALTAYPRESPPQDLHAALEWNSGTGAPAPEGSERSDYLVRMLGNRELTLRMILLGIAVAFGLGAIHAFSPGHGKTIVAAYLVGSRGTPKHALFLGGMVTATHTIVVFALGFVTLFLSRYVDPAKISPALEIVSGVAIIGIGATLLYKRLRAYLGYGHGHHHHHHDHDHDHGPHGHSHMPEGEVTMESLIALGASGGLVPCPSATILLLLSVRLDRVGLGIILLVGFSAGLAAVLTAIGLAVLYAKHLLPDESARTHPAFRLLPVVSAGIVLCIGLVMTGISLGVIHPIA